MPLHSDPMPPRWGSQYVTQPALIATGLASRSGLARERKAGRLVPVGRHGGRRPIIYRLVDVERWLAGDVPPAANARRERRRPSRSPGRLVVRVRRDLVVTARGRGVVGAVVVIAMLLLAAVLAKPW